MRCGGLSNRSSGPGQSEQKPIRLPVHLVDKLAKVRRVSVQMSDELGREPTDDELGEESGNRTRKPRLKKYRYPAGFTRRPDWG